MTPEEREALLAAHALGSLSAPDAQDAERLIRTDGIAAAEYRTYREIADLIALSVPLRRADPSLRQRVMAAARRSPRLGRAPFWRRWAPAAALAATLAVVTVWAVSLQGSLEDVRQEMALLSAVNEANAKAIAQFSATAQRVSESGIRLETQLKDQATFLEVQSDPDVVRAELRPTFAAHGASGYYLWSTAADAGILFVHGLPDLPVGQVYKVWLEDALSRTILANTFATDARGSAQVLLTSEGGANPVRVYIVAGGTNVTDGPLVLHATIVRDP